MLPEVITWRYMSNSPPTVVSSFIVYLRLGNMRNRELIAFLETRWSLLEDLLRSNAGMVILNREQLISY